MQAVTAIAHPNLALVKYWGQRDAARQLPVNDSISVNLSGATTTTTVRFDAVLETDTVEINDAPATAQATDRVAAHLERVRALAGIASHTEVRSWNSFPASIGIASSASAFAALTLAATRAAGLDLDARALSALARLGSGSACRSIPSGFAEWRTGPDDESYAIQLAPPDHWALSILTVYFDAPPKAISSLEGHRAAHSSPFFETRLRIIEETLETVRWAILSCDFPTLGMTVEREAITLHLIAMSSTPQNRPHLSGIYYWQPQTLALIQAVQRWRAEGLEVYFTLDAGPAVHLLCESSQQEALRTALDPLLATLGGQLIVSAPGMGARIVSSPAAPSR